MFQEKKEFLALVKIRKGINFPTFLEEIKSVFSEFENKRFFTDLFLTTIIVALTDNRLVLR